MNAPTNPSTSSKPSATALILTASVVLGVAHLSTTTTAPSSSADRANLRATASNKEEALLSRTDLGLGHRLSAPNKKNNSQDDNRALQGTGSVSGSSEVTGIATGAGCAGNMNDGNFNSPLAESSGFGTGTISNNGGSQGSVMTNYGQAQGNSDAATTGVSSGSGMTALLAGDPGILNKANSAGSVASGGESVFSASFNSNDAKDPTLAMGLGSGSVNVLGVSSGQQVAVGAPAILIQSGLAGASTTAGTSEAEGSATASNGMGAAGGVGSGSTSGSVIEGGSFMTTYADAPNNNATGFALNGASSGTFDGLGQGNAGGQGGSASGASNGGGTATNAGTGTPGYLFSNGATLQAAGAGIFTSNAGSSGFGQSMLGSAAGSSAAGSNGSTRGRGYLRGGARRGRGGYVVFQDAALNVAGSVDAVGSGGFSAAFSPDATTPTGGSGSGNGSLTVAQSATGTLDVFGNFKDAETSAATTGSANNFGGGTGVGSTMLGSAGSTGSGESSGSAVAGGNAGPVSGAGPIAPADAVMESFTSMGTATGDFDGAGEAFFGGSSLALQFP